MSRPRDGKEIKKTYTVRIEPKLKKKLDKKFGSLTKMVAYILEGLVK